MIRAANIPLPQVFSKDMEPIGRLHPTKANYHLKLTPLSTGGLELEGERVTVGQFVQLFDTFGHVGMFRVSQTDSVMAAVRKQTVKLEHAFVTLGDVMIAGYLEFGGLGTTTEGVLRMLLARQHVPYWTLGDCDFKYAFQYSVQNEYLINALLSTATPIPAAYQWVFDTSVFPFVLSLKAAPTDVTMELRLNRNVQQVKQRIDFTKMRNRLIPKGFGEGVNQLDITTVNGGVNYIQNEESIAAFGVVEDVYPDTKITDADTLLAAGQAVLNGCAMPVVTTEVSGNDVYALTGEALDSFKVGALARVPLNDYDISLVECVTEVKKADVYGAEQRATLVLSNQKTDIVSDTAQLMRKTRIAELYSQGSTCIYAISFSGNCDPDNPLEVWIPIDRNAASINVLQIKFKVTAFRAYSKAASASGGQARSTNAGTQATATIPATVFASTVRMTGPLDGNGDSMTATGGNLFGNGTTTGEVALTTASGGAQTTSSNGSHEHSFYFNKEYSNGHQHSVTIKALNTATNTLGVSSNSIHTVEINKNTGATGYHTHSVSGHTHSIEAHSHSVSVHQHSMDHKHGLSIGFTFPNMTLNVSGHTHTVTFGDHTHPIEYGIFRGKTASNVAVALGDNTVPASVADTKDFDAVPYMEKDSNGRIVRGWHKLTFTPDEMTGISGTAYVKTFVTAFTGGSY